ncbi:hypothetical protein BDK92_0274 [Micromonospora pisi]|uniref:Uncharacterized protein n=1 Tax=Micromonospora pisi TaxID=589240 RepID=A0A495JB39_9ACTN|nr:hypothetical protein [Micromonospora pisi]RKR86053.1 hypothetical protein BDK92_0274 [Micromonospora pisi]
MPAHRRPTPPPPRPAIGVLAALLVGSAGLGVAFTAVETSDPHRPPARPGSHTAQEIGPAAPAALTVPPAGSRSVAPTDTGAPMTPTADESIVEAQLVPDTSGSGAAEPLAPSTPLPNPSTPGRPRPTQTPRTPPPTHPSSTPTVTPTPSGSPSPSPAPSDPPPSTSPTPDPTPSVPATPTPTATVTPDPTRTPDPTPSGTGIPESTGDTAG